MCRTVAGPEATPEGTRNWATCPLKMCVEPSRSRLIERRYSLAGAGSECDKNFLSTLCSCVLMMLLMVVAAPQSHKPHFKCKAATTTTSRTTLAASATTTHTHSYTHTHIDTTWSLFNKLLPKNTWHSHESLLFISCSSWSSLSLSPASWSCEICESWILNIFLRSHKFSSQHNERAQRAMRVRENRNSTNFENWKQLKTKWISSAANWLTPTHTHSKVSTNFKCSRDQREQERERGRARERARDYCVDTLSIINARSTVWHFASVCSAALTSIHVWVCVHV